MMSIACLIHGSLECAVCCPSIDAPEPLPSILGAAPSWVDPGAVEWSAKEVRREAVLEKYRANPFPTSVLALAGDPPPEPRACECAGCSRAAELEAELAGVRREYADACGAFVQVYEAATGRKGLGPVRGFSEDAADVRAERDENLELLRHIRVWAVREGHARSLADYLEANALTPLGKDGGANG